MRELGLFSQAATAANLTRVGRPGNTPTLGSQTVGTPQDPADRAAVCGWTTTWTTAPTVPAPPMRQFDLNNVVGSGVIFTWPSDGEVVVTNTRTSSLIVFNSGGATGPILDEYLVWSE